MFLAASTLLVHLIWQQEPATTGWYDIGSLTKRCTIKGCISDSRNINEPIHLISPPDPLAARLLSRTSKKRVSVGQPVLRDHTQ